MKRRLLAGLICTAMLATPIIAPAHDSGVAAQLFSKQNIGRAVGAGVGTYLGSKIGRGSGKTLATGAGAIGGYLLGGKIGRDWGNGSSGASSTGATSYGPPPSARLAPLTYRPALDTIDSAYVATRASNVRGGPSTDYVVVDRLHPGEDVTVVGQVVNSDWFMVAENDIVRGFVYGPLLSPLGGVADSKYGGIIGGPVDPASDGTLGGPVDSTSDGVIGGPVRAAPARYNL